MNVKINEDKIKITEVKNSTKTLEVHMSPSLNWRDNFEHEKQKMKVSIKNIIKSCMNLHKFCLHFNVHVLIDVSFGYRIVNTTGSWYSLTDPM